MLLRSLSGYVYSVILIDMTNIHVGRRVVVFDKSCGTRKGNSLVCERAFWSSSSTRLHAKLLELRPKLDYFHSACHKAVLDVTMSV
jgi:hypothetical protein